jgi:Putative zinc-finger
VGALTIEPHDEFLELCAVSTSGQLTLEEQKKLDEHLAVCASCRQLCKQYETVVRKAIPGIAASESTVSAVSEPSDPSWSEDRAEKELFERLAQEQKAVRDPHTRTTDSSPKPHRLLPFSNESTWRDVWILYGAGILLFVGLSFYAYRVGVHHGTETAKLNPPPAKAETQPTLEAQMSDAGHERQIAFVQIEQRDKTITDLRKQLARQIADINELRSAKDRLEAELRASDASRQDVSRQRTELAQKLDVAVSNSQGLQQKLDSLTEQSAKDAALAKTLDAKVNELNRLLHDREATLDQKDELLAHDRDIRELMGARDLYIAEVHDVARDGQTQIPYGRVFYTKGKRLIFYAYDLGEQAGLKRASAFQAWGRRGPDREQAINLGVFYEDSAAKKRWILKCDDPKTLAQIDAVFVTVEPNGGSHKPSGKSLLFAYLKMEPNHP